MLIIKKVVGYSKKERRKIRTINIYNFLENTQKNE
tara:strand:- start:107 stop:211 length:105 start_codon:yes stop_codon:yes gene_type:complete